MEEAGGRGGDERRPHAFAANSSPSCPSPSPSSSTSPYPSGSSYPCAGFLNGGRPSPAAGTAAEAAGAGAAATGGTCTHITSQGGHEDYEGGNFRDHTERGGSDSPGTFARRRGAGWAKQGAPPPREGLGTAAEADEAVRVVSTCTTSDRGILALYGR